MADKITKNLELKDITSLEQLEKLNMSFEEAYSSLEKIVNLQERGEVSLEESMQYYKIGKILSAYANSILEKAKLEVEKVN